MDIMISNTGIIKKWNCRYYFWWRYEYVDRVEKDNDENNRKDSTIIIDENEYLNHFFDVDEDGTNDYVFIDHDRDGTFEVNKKFEIKSSKLRFLYKWKQMTNSNNLSKDTELSIDLLQYLKETIKLKQKSVRDISNYENKVFISDMQDQKIVCSEFYKKSVNENEEEFDDKWVEIKKPKINLHKVPTKLENWIDTKNINDPFINPVLLDVIEVPSENQQSEYDVKIKKLSENNYIKNLFDDYLKNKWIPWSKIEKINWNVQKVYEELYNIYSNQKLNETYEIYLGFGYLTWKTPSGYEVRRHCIASNISIEFDAKRGVITVRPSGINSFTYFEQDMLDHSEQIHGNEEEK